MKKIKLMTLIKIALTVLVLGVIYVSLVNMGAFDSHPPVTK